MKSTLKRVASWGISLSLAFAAFMLFTGATVGIAANQIRTAVVGALNLAGVAATEGTSQSLARADHGHSITGILPLANGGTGSATKNFVDLTTNQTAAGNKTWTGNTVMTPSGAGVGVAVTGGSSSGTAATFTGGSTNGVGVTSTGSGTGTGVVATGGSTSGTGGSFTGGSPNGTAVAGAGTGTGAGGTFTGGGGAGDGVSGTSGYGATGLTFSVAVRGQGVTPLVSGQNGGRGGFFTGGGCIAADAACSAGVGLITTGGSGDVGNGAAGLKATGGTGLQAGLFLSADTTNPTTGTINTAPVTNTPTSATNGDWWVDGKGASVRVGGATYLLSNNPYLSATSGAAQVIGAGATSIVVFGSVETDSDSGYASGTGRYTIPAGKGGDYVISSSIQLNTAQAGFINIAVYKNAVLLKYLASTAPQTVSVSLTGTVTQRLAAGDIIDIRCNNGGAGTQTFSNISAINYFTVKRVP